MRHDPDKHHRRSIRLTGHDYSQAGVYYVTICVQDRVCLFGKINNGELKLNDAGNMVNNWWNKLPQKFTNVELDDYIIMPNHVHGIIIVGADPVCPKDQNIINYSKINMSEGQTDPGDKQMDSGDQQKGEHVGSPLRKPVPLSRIIQWYKTMTTNEYIRNVKQNGWFPFKKHLWQRNYYEHIIRDENDLKRIRKYIIENPLNWKSDHENPGNMETK
ncbi:MAG: hypothetical protein A2Y94_04085 [Caldithrix sp. RBG_13_44_9]|nr:MAG: hypothetical protein A2Y94_04085 [Caldithrix sp. RBG_13_44_9]